MSSAAIAIDAGAAVSPAELGWKFIRGGLMLFLVGFLTGFVPLLHYWHGAVAGDVGPLFLKNMTLWWGCPAVLAELTLKAGSLGMVVIGFSYLALARDGSTTQVSSRERGAVTLCYYGLIAELVTAAVFYVVCNMIWPNFYFTPVQDGKNLWLLVQAISIAVYVYGVYVAVTSIRRTTPRVPALLIVLVTVVAAVSPASAQVSQQTLDAIGAPVKVTTRIGVLEYRDGIPTPATVQKAYDNLDFAHAVDVYLNAFQGVSAYMIAQGIRSAGVEDNQVLIFRRLMDAKSLFLTANADVVYYWSILDLTKGPMVLETPPAALGTLDDIWFNWIIDFGGPGPDRGEGGRFLILPPGYDGPVPEGGFYVARSKATKVLILGRSFLENNDPKPTVATIERTLKIYPYVSGGVGTSIAELLTGAVKGGRNEPPPATVFVEGTDKVMNTIPPSDAGFYDLLNQLVQEQPVGGIDVERMGQLASIGIVKGKPFQPDERMKKILADAAAVGMATSRTLSFLPRESEGFNYYPNSNWKNPLWKGGYTMETPPPMVTADGVVPTPPTGARTLEARTAFFYYATGVTPAMTMRLPNVGSQYLIGDVDASGNILDGGKAYKVTLPPKIPAARFWSFTLYDNQTRSMLDTPQRYPRAGSQSYPSPAAVADADGSTTVYFGPTLPSGVKPGNWIQTTPGKGWNALLRLYSPLPSFFSKEWKPGEIESVK